MTFGRLNLGLGLGGSVGGGSSLSNEALVDAEDSTLVDAANSIMEGK